MYLTLKVSEVKVLMCCIIVIDILICKQYFNDAARGGTNFNYFIYFLISNNASYFIN